MEITVRPRGCTIDQRPNAEGLLVTTLVFMDEGGTTFRVGGFGPEQWPAFQAIVADPEAALAAAHAEAALAEARAKIAKP